MMSDNDDVMGVTEDKLEILANVTDPSFIELKIENNAINAITLTSTPYTCSDGDLILDTPLSYANKYSNGGDTLYLLKKDETTYVVFNKDLAIIKETVPPKPTTEAVAADTMDISGGSKPTTRTPKKKPPQAKKKAPARRKAPAKKKPETEEPKLQIEESQWSLPLFRFLKFSM
jgi:hypothetical protein